MFTSFSSSCPAAFPSCENNTDTTWKFHKKYKYIYSLQDHHINLFQIRFRMRQKQNNLYTSLQVVFRLIPLTHFCWPEQQFVTNFLIKLTTDQISKRESQILGVLDFQVFLFHHQGLSWYLLGVEPDFFLDPGNHFGPLLFGDSCSSLKGSGPPAGEASSLGDPPFPLLSLGPFH